MAGAAQDRSSDLPWSFVFDPMANARALADVQRRGLEAARQVVDRLLAGMEQAGGSTGPAEDRPNGPPDLAELWAAFVYQTMSTFSASNGNGNGNGNGHVPSPEVGAVECSGGPVLGRIQLTSDGAGTVEPGSFWLQNSSTKDTGELRVQVGELRSPQGVVVTGLDVEPTVIASVGAGSARLVALRGTLSGSLVSGVYRGVIQVEGAPGVAVTLEVKVIS